MVEFGDEFIIDSYRIPWLIWIQILIMFLLFLLLLYSFSFSGDDSNSSFNNSDLSSSSSSLPSSSDTQKQNPGKQDNTTTTTSVAGCSLEIDQVVENQGKKGGTSRRRVIGEENIAWEASTSTSKDPAFIDLDHHPCHIVRLARIAFLKCLGLDPTTENSSERRKNR